MERKIDLYSILTPLEFESRCNMFVREAAEVAKKYPGLWIDASNISLDIIDPRDQLWWLEEEKRQTAINYRNDLANLHQNIACVGICETRVDRGYLLLDRAEDEIFDLAEAYRGIFGIPDLEDSNRHTSPFDDLDPAYHIHFVFKG